MNSPKELHYRYLISYLISAIILLFALAYFDVPALVDKLSFALTISSLVLAVLAIFYTVVSAQKQDLQLTKLIETNASLNNAANDITSAASEMRTFAREAPQHFQSLRATLDNMSADFDTVRSAPAPEQPQEDKSGEILAPLKIERPQFLWMFGAVYCHGCAVPICSIVSEEPITESDVFESWTYCRISMR